MAEEQNIYSIIRDNLIIENENIMFDCENCDGYRITLPIRKLNSFYDGNVSLSVYLDFEPLDFKNYELSIVSDFNHVFRVSEYGGVKNNYNVLYHEKRWFSNPVSMDDDDIHNLGEDGEILSTQLHNINFVELYNFIDKLKFCKTTNKLCSNLLPKDYIDKYIQPVADCSVCYENTTHKIKCGHSVCIDCAYKIMNEKRSASTCPICRAPLWK